MKMSRRAFSLLSGTALIFDRIEDALANFGIFQIGGDPWANLDGRGGAPTGVAQYPTLLNGYPIASPPGARTRWPSNGSQPPWAVAGVDYPVGLNYDTTFSGSTVTKTAHDFAASYGITFFAAGSGTLPTPLVAGTTYYLIGGTISTNTFQVATTFGGTTPVSFSGGSGVFVALIDVTAGGNDSPGTAFNNKQTALSNPVRYEPSGTKIIADGTGALIKNLDMGASGQSIWVQGFGANPNPNNVTVRNCRWLGATTLGVPSQFPVDGGGQIGSGMLVEKCLFDGNYPNMVDNLNNMRGCVRPSGPNCTIQYCWFKRYPNTSIQLVNSSAGLGADNCTFQYNLMDNCMSQTGSHGEPLQYSDYSGNNVRFMFNTIYAGAPDGSGRPGPYGTAGIVQLQAHPGVNHTYTGYECGNNTMISIQNTGHRDGHDVFLNTNITTPTNTISLSDVPSAQDVYSSNKIIIMHAPVGGGSPVIPDPTYAIFTGTAPTVTYTLFSDVPCTISRNTSGSASTSGVTQFVPYSLNNCAVNNIWVIEMASGSSTVNPSIHDNYCDLNGIPVGASWYLPSGTVTGVNFASNINIRTGATMASNGTGPA